MGAQAERGPGLPRLAQSASCPGPLSFRSALGAWLGKAEAGDDAACQAKFGVGRATLERMVSGEVAPEAELEDRIWQEVRWRPAPPSAAEGPHYGVGDDEFPSGLNR